MCEKFDFNVLRNGCGSCEESIDFVKDVTVHIQGFSPVCEGKVGESHETKPVKWLFNTTNKLWLDDVNKNYTVYTPELELRGIITIHIIS